MKRIIRKVAVLGSGIMGSRIACHFANIGLPVLLLDMVPKELLPEEELKGLTLDNAMVRNRIVQQALQTCLKSNPSPIYHTKVPQLISVGNFEDDMDKISDCDWVLEVVVERLDVKLQVFEMVERYRKAGTIISSNTSGIPIHLMLEGRTEDFKAHFCGTHFFNPPRYLKLLEIIPTKQTLPEVSAFLMQFGSQFLGKTTVLCKDTPAFIANRVGVYSMMSLLHLVKELDLTVEEIDKLSGVVLGRPKSATFRTSDVVGLDTLVNVANGLYANCAQDSARETFKLPDFVEKMMAQKCFGDKTGKGFYKKVKNSDGSSEILVLNLKTLEYEASKKVKFDTLDLLKPIADLAQRMQVFAAAQDKAGAFFRHSFFGLFAYVSHRIPEISDEIYRIDEALKAGFAWEMGPFEVWDALGIKESLTQMSALGYEVAPWVHELLAAGMSSFYKIDQGIKKYYDIPSKSYIALPGSDDFIVINNLRNSNLIWKNSGVSLIDLGDGILNVEFHSKMNTIGGDTLQGIHKAIDLAEKDFRGLVIGNDGANFSAGANVGMIFMMAVEQDWDEINGAVKMFQNTSMRIRNASIPVVVAAHQLCLGGGCEFSLHADHVQLSAETYMGLVEFGVGLIPGGGGSKEFALRVSDELKEGQIAQNILKERFLTIAMAKVSTSGFDAATLGYLQKGKYAISMDRNRLLADAKAKAIALSASYVAPVPRKDITVLGRQGLGIVYAGANAMMAGNYMSAHDQLISEKLGYVMCGGNLSAATQVSESYLLDLEREAFLSLCGERKTLERIQSIIKTGKALRN